MKAKAMAWLLAWFMIAQSTLISYHTEAFVKTEVACTVATGEGTRFPADCPKEKKIIAEINLWACGMAS